jgi:hypothetical protein
VIDSTPPTAERKPASYGAHVSVQARHRTCELHADRDTCAASAFRRIDNPHSTPPTRTSRPTGTAPDRTAATPTATTAAGPRYWTSTAAGCAKLAFNGDSDGKLAQYVGRYCTLLDWHFSLRHFTAEPPVTHDR